MAEGLKAMEGVKFIYANRGCGLVTAESPEIGEAARVDGVGDTENTAVAVVVNEQGLVVEVLLGEEAVKRRGEFSPNDRGLLEGDLLLPGFVDIHTHGLGGTDDAVNYWTNPGFTQQHLPTLGTTSFLASIVFPDDQFKTVKNVMAELVPRIGELSHGAVLEGVHAEGPCVHDLGAMPYGGAPLTVKQLEEWIESLPPRTLRMMTISPHLEADLDYAKLKCLLRHGILPALGHDRVASESDILGALRCSPDRRLHITHLFNVTNFHHRLPSLVNFGLSERFPSMPEYAGLLAPTVELIGDLAHVHPLTIKTTLSARHSENIAFVSDAIALPEPGRRTAYAGRHLLVGESGRTVKLAGSDTLAGSCASLLETFRNLVNIIGVSEADASAMLSANPARIVGLDHIGWLKVGCRADAIVLSNTYKLQYTVIGGRLVFTA